MAFREWDHPVGTIAYDADVSCETDTGGTVWVTIKEPTIEATEARAKIMREAAGAVHYERSGVDA